MITEADVRAAYRALLDRDPESPAAITEAMELGSLEALIRHVTGSEEYGQRTGDVAQTGSLEWNGRARVAFIHIPKTGGTTILSLLNGWYGRDRLLTLPGPDLLRLRLPALLRTEVLAGHVGHVVTRLLPEPVHRITMLRDPVARLVSNYNWLRATDPALLEATGDHVGRKAHDLDIDAFFADADVRGSPGFDNAQTRFLADIDPFTDPGATPPADTLLAGALRNLADCAAVGVVEEMARSIAAIARALGHPVPDAVPRENALSDLISLGSKLAITPQVPSAATLARLEPLVAADRVLHAAARQRLAAG